MLAAQTRTSISLISFKTSTSIIISLNLLFNNQISYTSNFTLKTSQIKNSIWRTHLTGTSVPSPYMCIGTWLPYTRISVLLKLMPLSLTNHFFTKSSFFFISFRTSQTIVNCLFIIWILTKLAFKSVPKLIFWTYGIATKSIHIVRIMQWTFTVTSLCFNIEE